MSKFKVGDSVVLKSEPYLNTLLVTACNEDKTYKCRWTEFAKRGKQIHKEEIFAEALLMFPPSRVMHLKSKH